MADIRLLDRWARMLLACLIAVSVLFAPLASAWSMPCHQAMPQHGGMAMDDDMAGQAHAGPKHISRQAAHKDGHSIPAERTCQGTCAPCLVVMNAEHDALFVPAIAGLPFQRQDQTGTGTTFPPVTGPPRFAV